MASPIPTQRREQVKAREMDRCFRCGGKGSEWHHRRSRSVRDTHTHCACNGVWVCKTCHDWAHAHPFDARSIGLIVSRHQRDPGTVPVEARFGLIVLDCEGKYTYHEEEA